MIHYITQGATEIEIAEGKQTLAQYAYKEDMPIGDQPLLSGTAIPMKTSAQVLLFGIPVLLLLLWEYRNIFLLRFEPFPLQRIKW
ncbi:hypothetical protein ACFTAO_16490 [Paenibacillus rhizoplanae]